MTGATMCSGIGAPETAAPWVDWKWCAEIERFPSAVLTHHRPNVPNLGDVTAGDFISRAVAYGPLDLFVAGTPCQGFSIAGLRGSLSDDRSNIMFRFVETADAINPRIVVWENVPGVLSTPDNAFGCLLGALAGHDAPLVPGRGQRWTDAGMVDGPARRVAWRILDAQYFGLAQRRERVFVVACPRYGVDPAEILFEFEGVQRNSPPSREAGPPVTALTSNGVGTCGADDNQAQGGHLIAHAADYAPPLTKSNPYGDHESREGLLVAYGGGNCSGPIDVATAQTHHGCRQDLDTETFVAHALRAEGFDASEDGTGRGTPLVPVHIAGTLKSNNGGGGFGSDPSETFIPVVFSCKDHAADAGEISPTLRSMTHDGSHANGGGQVAVALPILEAGARTGTSTTDPRAGIGIGQDGDPMFTLQRGKQHAVATDQPFTLAIRGRGNECNLEYRTDGTANALMTPNGGRAGIGVGAFAHHMAVRRLTPRECERLQGFPDDATAITYRGKPAADGPRYKALGNSMAVAVLRWVIDRAQAGAA